MEIGSINIDFSIISTGEPKYIWVGDNSRWYSAENLPSVIEITPPGAISPIIHTFQKYKLNIFQSVNLSMSCLAVCTEQNYTPLPDGIWQFTVKSGYEDIEKTRYYLKTDRFTVEFYKEWINTGLDYTDTKDKRYDALLDCKKHLISAEAYTLEGNFTKANREFQEAQKKFNKIRKCQYTA